MERVLMLAQHVEALEGGSLTYQAGSLYMIDDPLRQALIDAKKAIPESEHEPKPEIEPVPKGLLDVPDPPEVTEIEVANG
jgi:hypothetical protein